MNYVPDAQTALAWHFSDEATPETDRPVIKQRSDAAGKESVKPEKKTSVKKPVSESCPRRRPGGGRRMVEHVGRDLAEGFARQSRWYACTSNSKAASGRVNFGSVEF